jgi:5-formyltetrahydrofolate cyclo-ligase
MKKKELRKVYLDKRAALSRVQFSRGCSKIGGLLYGSFEWTGIKYLHHYLPILDSNEIDTSLILSHVISKNLSIKRIVPRVNKSALELEHLFLRKETILKTNKWGIPEPTGSETVPEDLIDLVIVPLLCFDKRGHRVGYGGGFYDRFLAKCRPDCIKIGVSLFDPVDQISDIHDGDVSLDFCVTPERVYEFGGQGR